MQGDPGKIQQAGEILARLTDADLETWGYTRRELLDDLARVDPEGKRPGGRGLSRYTVERKLLVLLRRNVHHNAFGRLVRRVRDACDVLLR